MHEESGSGEGKKSRRAQGAGTGTPSRVPRPLSETGSEIEKSVLGLLMVDFITLIFRSPI